MMRPSANEQRLQSPLRTMQEELREKVQALESTMQPTALVQQRLATMQEELHQKVFQCYTNRSSTIEERLAVMQANLNEKIRRCHQARARTQEFSSPGKTSDPGANDIPSSDSPSALALHNACNWLSGMPSLAQQNVTSSCDVRPVGESSACYVSSNARSNSPLDRVLLGYRPCPGESIGRSPLQESHQLIQNFLTTTQNASRSTALNAGGQDVTSPRTALQEPSVDLTLSLRAILMERQSEERPDIPPLPLLLPNQAAQHNTWKATRTPSTRCSEDGSEATQQSLQIMTDEVESLQTTSQPEIRGRRSGEVTHCRTTTPKKDRPGPKFAPTYVGQTPRRSASADHRDWKSSLRKYDAACNIYDIYASPTFQRPSRRSNCSHSPQRSNACHSPGSRSRRLSSNRSTDSRRSPRSSSNSFKDDPGRPAFIIHRPANDKDAIEWRRPARESVKSHEIKAAWRESLCDVKKDEDRRNESVLKISRSLSAEIKRSLKSPRFRDIDRLQLSCGSLSEWLLEQSTLDVSSSSAVPHVDSVQVNATS